MGREGPSMGSLDRFYQPSEQISFKSDHIGPKEGVLRFSVASTAADTSGYDAVLDLVYQAAEVVKGIENQATEAEKVFYQKLQVAQKRIEELETDNRTFELCISEACTKLKESDEVARAEKARLQAAERKMCELEMRARTAEAQAKENANAVVRIEEAIRTQLLAKRLPANKLALSA
jgi:membrane protein involved in colicin uptake